MSIVNSVEIVLQPFQHPPLDGKPRGIFGASLQTIGDASGGNITTGIVHTTGVGHDLILQFDSLIAANNSSTNDIFHVKINEGGIYGDETEIRGGFFEDSNSPLREINNYIYYPRKGETTILTFVTDNDLNDITTVSLRGRYWERSYLRERGETPAFR